jgi:hypothetical protein
VNWSIENKSFNCKLVFKADSALNGKIVVDLLEVTNANVYVYKMPNSFTTSHTTQGVLENNQIDARVQSGSIFEAPADWTIYLIYNKYNDAGKIKLTSSV